MLKPQQIPAKLTRRPSRRTGRPVGHPTARPEAFGSVHIRKSARALRISPGHLSKVLLGSARASLPLALKIGKVLGIQPEDLYRVYEARQWSTVMDKAQKGVVIPTS